MALYLTNIAMMQALRSFNNATASLNTSMQRLTTGFRINSAKDDPAGLMISNRMTSQIDGLYQASRNAADGQALANTAEGAIEEITNMLQRIRVLANQSANGTNTKADREALDQEVRELSEEITRIANKTTFGGAHILNGKEHAGDNSLLNSEGKVEIQVGADANDTIDIDLSTGFAISQMMVSLGMTASNPNDTDGTDGFVTDAEGNVRFSIDTQEGAQATLGMIDEFIQFTSSKRAVLGAVSNRLDSVLRLNDTMRVNLSDARSRIRDTDYAEESANLIKQGMLQQISLMMMQRAAQSKNIILQLLQG